MVYRDSLGNLYRRLPPPNGGKPKHSAKKTKSNAHGRQGRNKVKCQRYRAEGRREKNKARRAAKRQRWLDRRRMNRLPIAA